MFKTSCVLSVSFCVVTYLFLVGFRPLDGGTLGLMTILTFTGIACILRMFGECDGKPRSGNKDEKS